MNNFEGVIYLSKLVPTFVLRITIFTFGFYLIFWENINPEYVVRANFLNLHGINKIKHFMFLTLTLENSIMHIIAKEILI